MTVEPRLADLPTWNLADLYPGPDSAELKRDLDRSAKEARQLAEAWLRQINRRFVVGHGVAQPDARLRCGATVELTGLGPLFSGKYVLAEVTHRFDMAEGLRTEFVAERPWIGRAP